MSDPNAFISQLVGSPVTVKLNSGTEYRGRLTCLDGFLNVVLEQVEQ
ncbi:hypothetical protein KIPB_013352, partial [Kipferlia bialata]|eukprot:g13352.t1